MGNHNSRSLNITEQDSPMSIAMPHTRIDETLFPLLCTVHGMGYSGGETPVCNTYCKDNIHCTYMAKKKCLGAVGFLCVGFFFFLCVCALVFVCTPVVNFISVYENDIINWHVTRPWPGTTVVLPVSCSTFCFLKYKIRIELLISTQEKRCNQRLPFCSRCLWPFSRTPVRPSLERSELDRWMQA